MTYEECPDRETIVSFDGKKVVRYLCGCGECPAPDPTPQELLDQIDREWVAFNLGLAER